MVEFLLIATLLSAASASEDPHRAINPVYRELVQTGMRVDAQERLPLPAPTMPDGLSAQAQQARIAAIPERHVPLEELLRKSVVAPQSFRFRQLKAAGAQGTVEGVDVWFVAYGDLDTVAKKEFLDQLLRSDQQTAKIHVLTPAELEKRKIPAAAAAGQQERYVHSVFPVLDRVELSVSSHTYTSRTPESLVVAGVLDPRFAADAEYPNWWRSLQRDVATGTVRRGPAVPYDGGASYLKVTRLQQPRGALWVEYHLVFQEPRGWFQGANLLRSKLPMLIQSEVRAFRRQLAKQPGGTGAS